MTKRQLKLDPNTSDLEINTKGQWDLVEDPAQAVQCRLRLISGEWFLDESAGMRWFEDVLRRGIETPVIREDFRTIILGTDGITSIEALELDLDREARKLEATFRCNGDPLDRVVSVTV